MGPGTKTGKSVVDDKHLCGRGKRGDADQDKVFAQIPVRQKSWDTSSIPR